MSKKIKPIALYLPQFHPVPENDEWWGKGFTEWTNVAKARPLFKDHYQPHLPADLGFYDLRLEEARIAQENLAKEHGIYGFCYYHYWFNSRRILEEPLNKKLKNPKEDLPFMLCWANENWTRVWDGGESNVLLEQEYSEDDDYNHIQVLIKYFQDDRYIKVDGKPVFIVYRPKLIPDIKGTINLWREEVKKAGFPDIYIGFTQTSEYKVNLQEVDFDFAFEFQPQFSQRPSRIKNSIIARYYRAILKRLNLPLRNNYDNVYDYKEYVQLQIKNEFKPDTYPCVTPMWDNSARRKVNYFILHNSSPEVYKEWIKTIKNSYPWDKMKDSFFFINAWNEWAEGNHLEPCHKWGQSYLKATKEAFVDINT